MLGRAARPDTPLPTDDTTTAATRRALLQGSHKPHMKVIDVVDNVTQHAGAGLPVTLPSLLALPPAFDMGGASLDGVLRELKVRCCLKKGDREGPGGQRPRCCRPQDWPADCTRQHTQPHQPLVAEARALRLPSPASLFAARSLDDLRLRVQRFRLLGAQALEEEEEEEELSDMCVLILTRAHCR